ncbi:DUF3575 domain-containing protein [Mariniphaga sediminis]|jgi:hypothetical protein|uniref:DUF3575 domain-containing protein n=1 Tax=Mariniphaga sediminis TaxID=1628158 RepID=UPI00356A9006
MKKHTKILTGLLLLFCTPAIAQNNVIKAGFSDAFLGHFNLNYEWKANQKQSILLKLGYMEPTLSPFFNEKTITPSAYTLEESKGGINTSLEYRFYVTGKEPLQGLYIAPYARYSNQKMKFSDEIDDRAHTVDTRLNSVGIGAQLGYQLIIEERFTLDLYFFGAGIDHHSVTLKYQLRQPEAGFDYGSITEDVSNVFKDINYLHKRLEHEVNDDNLTTRLPFFFPGFRVGINLGIAF